MLSAVGCSRGSRLPTAPQVGDDQRVVAAGLSAARGSDRGRSFYPLGIGNRWAYEGCASSTVTPQDGEPITKRGTWSWEAVLARLEVIGGKEVVREERVTNDGYQEVHTLRWLRQDAAGLYEIGTPPPPRDSVTYPFPYEARLLAYPLHRGATWLIDEARRTTAKVEARELVETPAGRFPAWKIRVHHGGHLPQEEAFVWYGDAGYLGMRMDLQFERPDGNGGRIITTEHQEEWLKATTVLPVSRLTR